MSHERAPKRISTVFEMLLSVGLIAGGLYLLIDASSNMSKNDDLKIIPAAACLTAGGMAFRFVARSVLWHRKMMRRATNQISWERKVAQRELAVWEELIQPIDEPSSYDESFPSANREKAARQNSGSVIGFPPETRPRPQGVSDAAD